jgi:hypothetical protein
MVPFSPSGRNNFVLAHSLTGTPFTPFEQLKSVDRKLNTVRKHVGLMIEWASFALFALLAPPGPNMASCHLRL